MSENGVNKMFYSISEVASMLNIPASTLRYWEKELSSVNPRRSQGGTRRYTVSDIDELRIVHRLVKEEGHTIEGVKKILRRRRTSEESKQAALEHLQNIRKELVGMLEEYDRVANVK